MRLLETHLGGLRQPVLVLSYPKCLLISKDHEFFFWIETILEVKKVKLFLCQYFSIWMPFQNLKLFLGVLRFTEYKDDFSFVYITSNHKRSPPMARVAVGRIFPCRGPGIRGLRFP